MPRCCSNGSARFPSTNSCPQDTAPSAAVTPAPFRSVPVVGPCHRAGGPGHVTPARRAVSHRHEQRPRDSGGRRAGRARRGGDRGRSRCGGDRGRSWCGGAPGGGPPGTRRPGTLVGAAVRRQRRTARAVRGRGAVVLADPARAGGPVPASAARSRRRQPVSPRRRAAGHPATPPPGLLALLARRRGVRAPVDVDFCTWAASRYGDRTAEAGATLSAAATLTADPGALSAAFVWERLLRVSTPPVAPVPRRRLGRAGRPAGPPRATSASGSGPATR